MQSPQRRLPGIPGVRDVITAMDFVMAASKTKDRSPEFVAFRNDLLKITEDAERVVSLAGKADDIERLYAEARSSKDAMEALLVEAKAEADRITSEADEKFTKRETDLIESERAGEQTRREEIARALEDRQAAEGILRDSKTEAAQASSAWEEANSQLAARIDNVGKREKRADARQKKLADEATAHTQRVVKMRQAME